MFDVPYIDTIIVLVPILVAMVLVLKFTRSWIAFLITPLILWCILYFVDAIFNTNFNIYIVLLVMQIMGGFTCPLGCVRTKHGCDCM